MTLVDGIGIALRFVHLFLYPVEVVLRSFGISRLPRFTCALLPLEVPPLPLVINAQITLTREHWLGDINKVPDCRVRLSWYPVGKPDDVENAAGVWGTYSMSPMQVAHTLSEDNPLNFIPLFMIQARPYQIKGMSAVDRLYLMDGVFMAQEIPRHMLRVIEPGIYWFSVEILRGRRKPVTFKWLLSVSEGARCIRLEPALSILDSTRYAAHTIRRPAGGPAEVIVTNLFEDNV